jgi:hypothetical protein
VPPSTEGGEEGSSPGKGSLGDSIPGKGKLPLFETFFSIVCEAGAVGVADQGFEAVEGDGTGEDDLVLFV